MSDIFLYAGQPSPADIALRDPTFLAVQYNLSAGAGPFALTGINTSGKGFAGTVTAAAGAFALTGVSAALKAAHNVAGNAAALALAGKAAAQTAGRVVAPSSAVFTLSGIAAGLKDGRDAAESPASFALNGAAVSVVSGRALPAASTSVALAGHAAGTLVARVVSAAPAPFAVTGLGAVLVGPATRLSLLADSGSFAHSGQAAALSNAEAPPEVAEPGNTGGGRWGAGWSRPYRSVRSQPPIEKQESTISAGAGAFAMCSSGAQLVVSRGLPAERSAIACGARNAAMFADVWDVTPEEALMVLLEAGVISVNRIPDREHS